MRILTSCFAGDFEAALHGGKRGDEIDVRHGLRGAQETVDPQEGLGVGEILDPSRPAEPPAARSALRHTCEHTDQHLCKPIDQVQNALSHKTIWILRRREANQARLGDKLRWVAPTGNQ